MSQDPTVNREMTSGRVVQLMRPFVWRLLGVVGLLSALAITNMALPYMVKLLIDDAFPGENGSGGNWGLLWFILPGLGFVYVVRNSLFFSSRMMAVRVGEDLCFTLRKRLFEQMQQMSLRFYKTHQAGKIGSRVMDDTFKIQSFIQDKLPTFLLNVLMFQTLIVILYAVNWRLALASTLVLPMHFITYFYFRQPIKRSHTEAQENISAAYGNLVEKFLGIEVVKGFTAEERESDSFRAAIDASRTSQIRTQQFQFVQKVVADLLIGLATIGLLGFGALEVKNGRMQAGEFIMFYAYVGMLYPSVLEIITGASHMSKTTACVDRVFEMFHDPFVDETPATRTRTGADGEGATTAVSTLGATATGLVPGGIEFRRVSFQYDPATPVLHDLSLRIRPGEHVAITGPSGSGKSTMMKLLARFVDTTEGEIRLDNVPIPRLPVADLRRALSFAFQEVFLFNTSIYENLRYARPDVTLDEVVEMCQLTGAHDVIARLPNGYATRVGEYGGELSRGEKQRITLARALIKNPQILVLDEATASIDAVSARSVIESIFWLMEGRTVIMVTHDIALLDLADRVIAIADGRVVFDGTPAAYLDGDGPSEPAVLDDDAPAPIRFSPAGFGLALPGASSGPGAGRTGGSGATSGAGVQGRGPVGRSGGAGDATTTPAETRRSRTGRPLPRDARMVREVVGSTRSGRTTDNVQVAVDDRGGGDDLEPSLFAAHATEASGRQSRSGADNRNNRGKDDDGHDHESGADSGHDGDSDRGSGTGQSVGNSRGADESAAAETARRGGRAAVMASSAPDPRCPAVPVASLRYRSPWYDVVLAHPRRWPATGTIHPSARLAIAMEPSMTAPGIDLSPRSAETRGAAVRDQETARSPYQTTSSDEPAGADGGLRATSGPRGSLGRWVRISQPRLFPPVVTMLTSRFIPLIRKPREATRPLFWRPRPLAFRALAVLRPAILMGAAGLLVGTLGSCVSSERHVGRSIELVEPKTTAGVIAETDPQTGPDLDQLAENVDRWSSQPQPAASSGSGVMAPRSRGGERETGGLGYTGPDPVEVRRVEEWERLMARGAQATRRTAGAVPTDGAADDSGGGRATASRTVEPRSSTLRANDGPTAELMDGPPRKPAKEDLSWLAGADEWPSLMAWDAEFGTQPRPPQPVAGASAEVATDPATASSPVDVAVPGADDAGAVPSPPPAPNVGTPAPLPLARVFPPDAGRLVDLPKLGLTEIHEVLDRLALSLEAERGYVDAPPSVERQAPATPEGVTVAHTLYRDAGPEGVHLARLGFRKYLSQPPQLWVWATVVPATPDEQRRLVATADTEVIDRVAGQVQTILDGINAMRSAIVPGELERRIVQLSYVDPTAAVTMLRGLGITALADAATVPNPVPFNQLPLVIQTPTPSKEQIGLVGTAAASRGEFGQSTTPTEAVQLPDIVNMAPTSQLMVLYHPAFPEQFSQVRSLLDEIVDRPARQIFVEGMVLEISESGLEDLGIEWQFKEGPFNWLGGTLDPGGVADTLIFDYVEGRDFARDWSVKLRALIRDGKAEILSRPSVLTLNNRQATIRVGQDIPIATSQEGFANYSNKIAFTFKYLATGILLNVRPRIVEDGSEVGMLVDAVVSNVVPGADLEIRSEEGDLLASAPTVSTRRVQTYARIRNNTPFIIGGLVSRDYSTIQDKVPILGDLPLVGVAFRAERTSTIKREVIIVLTPYVLSDEQDVARSLPKDEDVFDSFGNQLFRDAYRIRSEDVYDLSFLLENRRLRAYRDIAEALMRENFQLVPVHPFSEFARGRIPGEDVLVHRMIYEVIKRLDAAATIDPERIIFFESAEGVDGYNVSFVSRVLTRLGGGEDYTSFFENNQGKALALIYHNDRDSLYAERMASEPIPELALIDCPDEKTWRRLLWELNQPSADGRQRATILIRNESDYTRLRRALMLKKVIKLNGGKEEVGIANFQVGKLILMPEIKPGQAHVVDVEVARLFYHTELYYAAALERIGDACRGLDAYVADPNVRAALDGVFIPTPVQKIEERTPGFLGREAEPVTP